MGTPTNTTSIKNPHHIAATSSPIPEYELCCLSFAKIEPCCSVSAVGHPSCGVCSVRYHHPLNPTSHPSNEVSHTQILAPSPNRSRKLSLSALLLCLFYFSKHWFLFMYVVVTCILGVPITINHISFFKLPSFWAPCHAMKVAGSHSPFGTLMRVHSSFSSLPLSIISKLCTSITSSCCCWWFSQFILRVLSMLTLLPLKLLLIQTLALPIWVF